MISVVLLILHKTNKQELLNLSTMMRSWSWSSGLNTDLWNTAHLNAKVRIPIWQIILQEYKAAFRRSITAPFNVKVGILLWKIIVKECQTACYRSGFFSEYSSWHHHNRLLWCKLKNLDLVNTHYYNVQVLWLFHRQCIGFRICDFKIW